MSSHFFVRKFTVLLFLFLCADFTHSKVLLYITPSLDGTCPQNSSCLTLSQLVANSSNHYDNNEMDVSLAFLPGNHTLNKELFVTNKEYFSMEKTAQFNGTIYIKCVSSSGKFVVNKTISVVISSLHFIGCGGNRVVQTEQIIIIETIFQGVQSGDTVLVLNEVTNASIIRSEFLFNTHSRRSKPKHNIHAFITNQAVLEYVFLKRNASLIVGGALDITSSNVSIVSSKFMHNRAELGGAFVAHSSSLRIARSTFSNNSATFGGAMITSECSVNITDSSTFSGNRAEIIAGVMMTYKVYYTISASAFSNNSAEFDGGVLRSFNISSFAVTSCKFTKNRSFRGGGSVITTSGECTVTILMTDFSQNFANHGGVISTLSISFFTIIISTFANNSVEELGGVIRAGDNSSFNITDSIFVNNSANIGFGGGVVCTTERSSFVITNSSFINNSALLEGGGGGGVVTSYHTSSFTIMNSNFVDNRASYGGVIKTFTQSSFTIVNSSFVNNRATGSGGVMFTLRKSSITIISCIFMNNKATRFGGVMDTENESLFNITNSTFSNNGANNGGTMSTAGESLYNNIIVSGSNFTNSSASGVGGVVWCSGGLLRVDKSRFDFNEAENYGGVLFSVGCSVHFSNSTFDSNMGSLYTFSSNLTFSGITRLENNINIKTLTDNAVRTALNSQEGGAITSFKSNVIFSGFCSLLNNKAGYGGAILAIESKIMMYGETTLKNNTAVKSNGGGISLQQSTLEVMGNCDVLHNYALRGGGIHATSSSISVRQPGVLRFSNNRAENGSGIYLQTNPKLYVLRTSPLYTTDFVDDDSLMFLDNHAKYGGAVYVADSSNSASCSPNIECFIQSLALHQNNDSDLATINIHFSGNSATENGPDIYGGLLDRCIPSPFAEVYLKETIHYSGVTYLGNISDIQLYPLASEPIRVCFCDSEHEPDCSYQPQVIRVKKGNAFSVFLVAVDQVNHTVQANIITSLSSPDGGFGEGQQTQNVRRNCTSLTFNVFSPHDSETINLYPDGPCGSATLSTSHVTIHFINCTCPVGFEPLSNNQSTSRCECGCDSELSPYITNCDATTAFVVRERTQSWIEYVNDTDPPGFIIQANCPYDYCFPPSKNVRINFNAPLGADSQCAYNHTGVLCGACKENLSLSLASSRCIKCYKYWPAVLVTILLSAAIAGMLLVTALLALNLTVAVGFINGFIFYANILDVGGAIFFPTTEPSFPSVFVAWLNLDIGIDVCFFDGLDAYIKTWLQLAFPVYIISLVALVIIVSEYSPKFTRLIGRRDPIATLATLILLSYAKLLSITITALSYAVLHYPDGSQDTVWLPDGNVPFFKGKHIPLVLVAVVIILIGLPYTFLLFLWQWIVRAPRWKVFGWITNTKLNAFIDTYHAPYNTKYRYWTGLLLLVRVALYVTSSLTVSAKPQTTLLVIILFMGGLLFHKGVVSLNVYKNSLVDIVDTILYFNLLALAVLSLYDFKTDVTKQTAVIYTSTVMTFILLIGVVIHHVTLLPNKCTNCIKVKTLNSGHDLKERLLHVPFQQDKAEVTHSVVELPKRQRPAGAPLEILGGVPKTVENETLTYQ